MRKRCSLLSRIRLVVHGTGNGLKFIRFCDLLHGPRTLGDATEIIANELMINYYRDHQSFYTSIQNFVLHLHVHYANQYRLHGSLSNLGTFGQESLLGHFAKNRHGTHHFGELITNNYNVDFTIHNQPNSHSSSRNIEIDGIFDLHDSSISRALHEYHNALCICDKIDQCISIYRRCRLKHTIYHSLLYRRRGSSVSYFVQYSKGHDDNLFGSLEDCNSEYARLTRLSQDQADDQNDDDSIQDAINMINSSMKNIRSSKIDRTRLSSSTSSSPRISTCAQTPEKIDVEVSDSDDEENSFFDCRKRTKKTLFESSSKKRRSTIGKPLTQRVSTASNDENSTITMSNKNKSNIQSESNVLQDIDNRVNQLNEKLISNSSKFDQLMQKLYVKIDRLTSNINVHKHALEPYVDKTGETFPDVLMFNNYNLLDLMATDYGNYARKILRIVFSQDELKSSILPPGKPHLRRQPLDQDRFKICMDAIRYKFKLDAVNFGLFYRALLRRKLTDFLIEERRRQST
ncbi:unnamed protein product [Rotaria socialis]|uniref:Uncharacterized protein n=2 Tax=Rotaria socialis TaxID=392032 RepID=A0A819YWX0_9BILA|nr:unnamed protein product [Rotaria socialis]CAF4154935.1 unnamed protein product [Rotaria socialis]